MSYKKEIKNRIEYIAFMGVLSLFRALPYDTSKKLVLGIFDLIGYRIGVRKQVAKKQLRKVFTQMLPKDIDTVLRKMYRNLALSTWETYFIRDEELISTTTIDGREYVDEALASGRGAILVTAHYGNWEAARVLPQKSIPVAVITKKQRNTLFNDYTDRIRKSQGASLIDMKQAFRGIVHHLAKNELVAILADQNAGSRGFVTEFLGYPASHWKGAAKISLKMKIPIVPGFAHRCDNDTICVRFEPLIYHPDWDDSDENCMIVIQEINTVIEKYIRKNPEQWFWVHKRWKNAYDMFKESD